MVFPTASREMRRHLGEDVEGVKEARREDRVTMTLRSHRHKIAPEIPARSGRQTNQSTYLYFLTYEIDEQKTHLLQLRLNVRLLR